MPFRRLLDVFGLFSRRPTEPVLPDRGFRPNRTADDYSKEVPYRYHGKAHPQFRISYANDDGAIHDDEIYVRRRSLNRSDGPILYCWSFAEDKAIQIRPENIRSAINIETGKQITDLGRYVLKKPYKRGRKKPSSDTESRRY